MMKVSPPPKQEDDNQPVKKYVVLEHISCNTFSLWIFHQAKQM